MDMISRRKLCSPRQIQRMRERRDELRAKGLCIICAVNPSLDRTYCGSCKTVRQEHARRRLAEIFDKFLEMYGRVCACCGEAERGFLTADHINNDGWKDRKPNGSSLTSSEMTYRIYVRKRRDDIQTLCYNCNCAKQRLGYCPHRPEERIERRVRGARRRDGEHNTQAKLTEAQVMEIRASSETYAALGRRYEISDVAARLVKLGITYQKSCDAGFRDGRSDPRDLRRDDEAFDDSHGSDGRAEWAGM